MKKTLFPILVLSLLLNSSCEQMETQSEDLSYTDDELVTSFQTADSTTENLYIVVFKNSVTDPETKIKKIKSKRNFSNGHVYKSALKGFSAALSAEDVKALKEDNDIAFIEPDVIQKAYSQTIPTGVARIMANTVSVDIEGIDVAVIDSGVDTKHPDLNVVGGVRFYTKQKGKELVSSSDNKYDDDLGHGTHVAGIIGAINNNIGVVGVAPGCNIWAVKVLDKKGNGYLSDIIMGLDWVAERASEIEVINLSLGGTGYSQAYRDAIKNCVSKGIIVFAAAGNSGRDIYGYDNTFGNFDDEMPAAFPEVAAISALADSDGQYGGWGIPTSWGPDDSFAFNSNNSKSVVSNNPVNSPGKAIDLLLPGIDIYSTAPNKKYKIMSGTSMACPHAAGLAVLYIAQSGRAQDSSGVYAIRQALIDNGKNQSSIYGLNMLNDPDGFYERIGWTPGR